MWMTGIWLLCAMAVQAQYGAEVPRVVTSASMGIKGNVEEVSESYTDMTVEDGIGVVTERKIYRFDKQGRLQAATTIATDGKKQKKDKAVSERYHYDRDGNLASVATWEDDKRTDSVAMFYNSRDRIYRKWTYDAKDRVYKRVQYTWNKSGRLMTVRHKDGDNDMERMIKLSYSDDGATVEQAHLDATLKLLHRIVTVTSPDSGGGQRVMRFEYYKPDTCTGMISRTTDAQGHVTEETTMDGQKNVTRYSTTVYDAHGGPDSTILYTTEKWRIHYLNTYDGHGNWIVQAVYRNNTPYYTLGRLIIYRAGAEDKKSHIIVNNPED